MMVTLLTHGRILLAAAAIDRRPPHERLVSTPMLESFFYVSVKPDCKKTAVYYNVLRRHCSP